MTNIVLLVIYKISQKPYCLCFVFIQHPFYQGKQFIICYCHIIKNTIRFLKRSLPNCICAQDGDNDSQCWFITH